jgi:hypothetical protein
MALGYGYVKRDEPQQIDWGAIGKEMTDFIKSDQESRTKRKEEIQNQYSDFTKTLIDKPVGYNTDLNNVISSYTNQASIAALNNLNKLKRGEISEQEYYNKRANLKSSTENFFLYSKNFNSKLDENMKLAQSQDPNKRASGKMIFQMGLAQDMFDFKNTKAIIDPITDELILVKTDENGNPTNEVVNVSQLGTLSSQQELEYNYKGRIARALENRGVAKYTKEDGTIVTTLQGVEITPGTASATIDKLAESFVGDESQILSILYQNGYQYTQDESLKGKDKYIYYDIKNGTYDYDKDKAVDFVKEDINNSIPVSIDTSKVETELDKRLKKAQVTRAEGLADIVKEELEDLKLDQDSEDEAVNDITNFVKNEFPIPETFVKNQTNVKSLLTSGLQNLGYTFGKYNKDSITVNVPGGDSFQVSIAGIDDAEGIVNKIVEAVFINKPITDIAKLAKVRGVLTATEQTEETPGEETVEITETKTGILD